MTFRMNCIASAWQVPADGTGVLPGMPMTGEATRGHFGNLPERPGRAE